MLKCCIRRKPSLTIEEYTFPKKKGEDVEKERSHIVTPPYITLGTTVDLEAGLEHPQYVVYKSKYNTGSCWTHGARVAI